MLIKGLHANHGGTMIYARGICRVLASWIEISVKNQSVFVKTGKTGFYWFYRFIENRSVKFEFF
jgi:hypothetical protein